MGEQGEIWCRAVSPWPGFEEMPKIHVVEQGECLIRIARRHGFADYKKLYAHPANEALRAKRPNPNVLFPGDEVVIPDAAAGGGLTVKLTTGNARRIVVPAPTRLVRLVLRDAQGEVLANMPYTLTLGEEQREGTTDGQGYLEQPVAYTATQALLECEERSWQLALGCLNPLTDVPDGGISGAEARLINLGYALEPTGQMNAELRSALRAFQHRGGLEVTGRLDAPTRQKLTELHGS